MNLKVGWGLADLGWFGCATLLLALDTAGHGFSLRFAFKSATCVLGLRPHEGDNSCVKKLFSHPGRGASKRAVEIARPPKARVQNGHTVTFVSIYW